MLVRGVVRDQVDEELQTTLVARCQQAIEAVEVPEQGVDVAVVGDVVAEVGHGGGVEGGEPHGVDAQPDEVVEVTLDPRQVAGGVPVAARERTGVDLVEDRALPPGSVHGDDGREPSGCAGSFSHVWQLGGRRSPTARLADNAAPQGTSNVMHPRKT
jgi:hypothetical protein